MVIKGIKGFRDDYLYHIQHKKCSAYLKHSVPCVATCPANVDIPGYIAFVKDGRYAEAVNLIRKDNPFPTACAYICEHVCETKCRRNMVDDAINIRALKKMAVDCARDMEIPGPDRLPETGKKIAVVGGGPSGLSCAYYLQLMGHEVDVYEANDKLGGMLRYGIPMYRLPRERLDDDINNILATGVKVFTNKKIGSGKDEINISDLKNQYDAVYIAIGAQLDNKLNIEGEDAKGVMSAVEMLHNMSGSTSSELKGKRVIIVGGGNVAMDCARTAIRLGAASVGIAYRRRQADMTALSEEIEGAKEEGCQLYQLKAPKRIEKNSDDSVKAFVCEPQITGPMDKMGRPSPVPADVPELTIDCDVVIVAIGQKIDSKHFEELGVPVKRGALMANSNLDFKDIPGIFAGGDCVTGPNTAVKAIAAGKVAAANIDAYLGYHHDLDFKVDIPPIVFENKEPAGRVNLTERLGSERKNDFECIECPMTKQEAAQEAGRCLRCDHFGFGSLRGGRIHTW